MTERAYRNRRPRRSLRTILLIWFLLLSLVPLMFVTGYSLVKYEQAMDYEFPQRLRSNAREFVGTITDYEKYLVTRRSKHRANGVLSQYLLTSSENEAREYARNSIKASVLPISLSLFNRDGELIASLSKDESGNPKENTQLVSSGLSLSDAYKEKLAKSGQMTIVDAGSGNSMDLIAYTRLEGKGGRTAGYVEEIVNVGPHFLENLKRRSLGLEVVLFDAKGHIIAGSHPDFLLYTKSGFAKTVLSDAETFFDLMIRDEPYGFITNIVKWGDSQFVVALGASKQRVHVFVRNLNYAFFTMVGAIGVLLVLTSIVATRVIVRPVYELVEALRSMETRDGAVEIPVTTDTELGVLTDTFNEMSRKIYQGKLDLETKIQELEDAYSELKDTQARLVHSAKMASLGQLVAGIAHELNNPIGFIYSNMSHLRDYSERLARIIEAAEKSPAALAKAKAENDFDYIVSDLPRLISSCEDGASRTRDIVLGLRNFSRLEEAKIKRVSLREGIENTLQLLSGELKNRVNVHTDFRPVPEALCYASQLNQVFMNILSNAAQAIDGNGDIWVKLDHDKKNGLARVSVRDSGKGIPSDSLERIFDPFYTTKTVGQGTGLGLSISYGIVKKHGGDIQVRSELGKGTEFIITIPIDGQAASEAGIA